MAFQECAYHSNNPRWSYFLYSNFRGPPSDLSMPTKLTDHRIIRGGPWHEWLGWAFAPPTCGPARYNGNGWVVRGDATHGASWPRCWLHGLANGVLEIDVRVEGVATYPTSGAVVRVNEDDNSCLTAFFDGFPFATINLSEVLPSGSIHTFASAALPSLAKDTTYHLEVDFHGPIIKVSVDGVEYIDTVSYYNLTERGVGLWTATEAGAEQQFARFRLRRN